MVDMFIFITALPEETGTNGEIQLELNYKSSTYLCIFSLFIF